MKNVMLLMVLASSVILMMSFHFVKKVTPSGDIVKKTMSVESFSEIEVSHGIELILTQEKSEVVIESYENLFDLLEVSVSGNKLKIRYPDNTTFKGKHKTKAYVSTKTLQSITVSGGAKVKINEELKTERFKFVGSGGATFMGNLICTELIISLSGGGQCNLLVKANKIKLNGSGGSQMTMNGQAHDCNLSVSGGGNFSGENLELEKLNVNLSGGSTAKVNVKGEISCSALGGSNLYYSGNPKITKSNCSGGSKLCKR